MNISAEAAVESIVEDMATTAMTATSIAGVLVLSIVDRIKFKFPKAAGDSKIMAELPEFSESITEAEVFVFVVGVYFCSGIFA